MRRQRDVEPILARVASVPAAPATCPAPTTRAPCRSSLRVPWPSCFPMAPPSVGLRESWFNWWHRRSTKARRGRYVYRTGTRRCKFENNAQQQAVVVQPVFVGACFRAIVHWQSGRATGSHGAAASGGTGAENGTLHRATFALDVPACKGRVAAVTCVYVVCCKSESNPGELSRSWDTSYGTSICIPRRNRTQVLPTKRGNRCLFFALQRTTRCCHQPARTTHIHTRTRSWLLDRNCIRHQNFLLNVSKSRSSCGHRKAPNCHEDPLRPLDKKRLGNGVQYRDYGRDLGR
ncbi:uncharacterized protein LOC144109707 [Amblyomma americanum]